MNKLLTRFKCVSIIDLREHKMKNVALVPVKEGSEENNSFSIDKNSGSLVLDVSYGTPAENFFATQKEYHIEISEIITQQE